MLVDLSRGTDAVVGLDAAVALEDFEVGAWYHDVGGVGAAGPFLAVGAVAEGGYCWLACRGGGRVSE